MTCCTFVYSVINLIWNKQYVFFILVVSDLNGPRSVTKYDKKWIKSFTDWQHNRKRYYDITFWKNGGVRKYEENGELQEQIFVFLL